MAKNRRNDVLPASDEPEVGQSTVRAKPSTARLLTRIANNRGIPVAQLLSELLDGRLEELEAKSLEQKEERLRRELAETIKARKESGKG